MRRRRLLAGLPAWLAPGLTGLPASLIGPRAVRAAPGAAPGAGPAVEPPEGSGATGGQDAAVSAEQISDALNGESLGAAVELDSVAFAAFAAQTYLPDGSGPDWLRTVRLIHAGERVSALFLAALQEVASAQPALVREAGIGGAALPAAAGVPRQPAGRRMTGLEQAALAQLLRPDAARGVARRLAEAQDRGLPEAALVGAIVAQSDAVEAALALRMNRAIALADGFREMGGFAFPTPPATIAEELWLFSDEWREEIAAETALLLWAAYAPLGAGAMEHVLARTVSREGRALGLLHDLALGPVLAQLARETGREAARRGQGAPL